jgi:DNA-directed RNA polymerase specialized sigma24 family protein
MQAGNDSTVDAARRASANKGWLATHRSMLLRAKQRDTRALAALCQIYWEPVYGFVRAHGIDRELAREVTQGVFDNLLRRDLRSLDLDRASRFRSWLKRVTRSHLFNELKQRRRIARIEVSEGEADGSAAAATAAIDAEGQDRLFDQRTALALIARAWERLQREKYADQSALFEHVKQSLSGEETALTDAALSAQLGQCDCYVRSVRKRVKDKEFPSAMRDELRSVGVGEPRLDEELRSLCAALG